MEERLPLQPPSNMAAEADANVKGNIKNKCRIKIRILQLQAAITPRMYRFSSCLCLSWHARADRKGGEGGVIGTVRRMEAAIEPAGTHLRCFPITPPSPPNCRSLCFSHKKSPGNHRGNMLRGFCV